MAYLGDQRRRVRAADVALTLTDYVGGHLQPWHSHANPTYAFVIRGAYREIDRRATQDVGPRTLLWHSTVVDHSGVNCPDGCRVLNIELLPSWVAHYGQEAKFPDRNLVLQGGPAVAACMQLLEEMRSNDDACILSIESAALQLVASTMRHVAREERTRSTRWIQSACQVAKERFGDRITMGDLAIELGVDAVTFSREFRRQVGMPFHQYVLDRRINYVKRRLRRDDATIAEIAAEAGFTDQAHLCRVFKRETGVTPSTFRREFTNERKRMSLFRSA